GPRAPWWSPAAKGQRTRAAWSRDPCRACPSAPAPYAGGRLTRLGGGTLGEEVFEVDPLPDVGRHAMARRVGRERGLGGRVHAPLGRQAVLARRRVEIRATGVRDDGDVAVGLAPRGDRPVHLPVVEHV